MALGFLLVPMGAQSAQAAPACEGEPAPQPEAAGSGSDGLLVPPQSQEAIDGSPDGLPPDSSLYGQYGTAGQQWHVIRESCVDKIGSTSAATLSNTAWDLSKTINQSTITVYQAATSDGLLDSFNNLVTNVVEQLREGIWRPLLPTVIIIGAVWLGWYGLIRKRLTLTIESAIWMVLATTIGIWILVNPTQILGYAGNLVNSGGQLVNSAISKVSVPGTNASCPAGAPEMKKADWESSNEFAVRKNSNMLWSGLVCQPWAAGVFGSGPVANTAEERHGTDLIAAQGVSRSEQQRMANDEIDAKDLYSDKNSEYEDIASDIENTYPEVYPLFEGEDQTGRLGVATLALFSSIFAGGLILAGSVALIVLKIGFLLLMLLSPVFLLIGVHPGYGRTVLLRWFEMLIGLLLKQIFVVLLISLLVMCYGLVMATDLGWGLQMILLALFTLALFIYRKPFGHLFASVNANTFTSRMVSDTLTSSALSKSANVLPPVAYARAQKWGLKRSPQLAAAAGAISAGSGTAGSGTGAAEGPETARGLAGADSGENDEKGVARETGRARGRAGYGRVRDKSSPPPLQVGDSKATSESSMAQHGTSTQRSTSQAPRLSEVAPVGHGGPSRPSSAGDRDGRSGPIPPRPPGGYTGTGDTGWASVFGTGSGSGHRPAPERRDAGSDSGRDGRADPTTGRGIFKGREATPPQGNVNKGARWAGPRTRRERGSAPRPQRPAPPPPNRGEGGSWLTGSSKRNNDAPISPFWTGSEAQRRRDPRRDIPFWLRDED